MRTRDRPASDPTFVIFIGLCALVYGAVGIVVAAVGRIGTVKASYQRVFEGIAGSLLAFAAVNMARN
jgi:threonine/homoserine/homoserine lactone efflux protein